MIDLDHFKTFNDTFGHGAGDLLLQHAAAAWRVALLQLAPAATLARYGGEEFAIILPGVDESTAANVLRALLQLTPESQTFSAGVAKMDPDERLDDVLRRADLRLYEAKAGGRARVVAGVPLVDTTSAT
jgi:diguanylate cyclase (GGDEF)-like protein